MIKNYLKIAWRNLIKNKSASFINIGGLAVGMAVAILIGLWMFDELSFDKHQKNYDRMAQLVAHIDIGEGKSTWSNLPMPVAIELRNKYGSDFKEMAATMSFEQPITFGEKALIKKGCYAEPAFTHILSLDMVNGTQTALTDPKHILINESLAHALFGTADPINQTVKLNSRFYLLVGGVYKDIPNNSRFADLNFITGIDQLVGNSASDNWNSNSFEIFALINPNADMTSVSARIKNLLYEHTKDATKPALFLNAAKHWHLYEFKNGELSPGRLQFVWLFGTIGVFVLLLACINFMNLTTARSEKRAKEVGIRKAIGSLRGQLIRQFLSESFLIVLIAFVFSLLLVQFALPWFNEVSAKQIHIPLGTLLFWLTSISFCLFTGLIAGSYPALYLSSFKPVKVLKGTFRVGRFAAMPRKVLVVLQFTVSAILIIGTIVVFRQIQFAKDRPVGYTRNNLLSIPYNSSAIANYNAFRNELLKTKAVDNVAASSSPITGIWSQADNFSWKGKDPSRQELFGTVLVDPNFGNVVNWTIKEGRNFSKEFLTDSSCFLLNESAVKQMGLKDPLGEIVQWHGKEWKVIGIVKDMVMSSPFDPAMPTVFLIDDKQRSFNVIDIKLNANSSMASVLAQLETVFKKFAPGSPFTYRFADTDYAAKFSDEERVGKLASFFTILAIFISCLGLFGMASFVAEQRVKEIGVRKILGASVYNLWQLLSKDFVLLVFIALLIASPTAYYFMHNWLQRYTYRTGMPWWIFAVTGFGAITITLLTVSFQAIKAAIANPVKSLRTE